LAHRSERLGLRSESHKQTTEKQDQNLLGQLHGIFSSTKLESSSWCQTRVETIS
jgi:hypothetical protein